MSQRYKSPHQARSSSEQSQRSQPGRLGWRDCCQEEKQNYTAPSACSFVFLGEAELVLDFLTTSPPPSGESARLEIALWAAQAPLSNQVSAAGWSGRGSRRFWSGWENFVLLVLWSEEPRIAAMAAGLGGHGFLRESAAAISDAAMPHAACQSGPGAAAILSPHPPKLSQAFIVAEQLLLQPST